MPIKRKCALLLDFDKCQIEATIRDVFGKTYDCIRSDQTGKSGNFVSDVVRLIGTADLVIADISGHNPNVLYELGLAHAFRRETLVVKCVRDLTSLELPADLSQYQVIPYVDNVSGGAQLTERLERARVALEESSGVSGYLKEEIQWIEARIRASDLFEDAMSKVFTNASHPLTAVLVENDPAGATVAHVRAASPDANRFYGYEANSKALVGSDLTKLLTQLRSWMDPDDYQAFSNEQVEIGKKATEGIPAYATVPIRLNRQHPHPELRGRAFLPMVLGVTEPLGQRSTKYTIVLYLDVAGFLDNLVANYVVPTRFFGDTTSEGPAPQVRFSELLQRLSPEPRSGPRT